MGAGTSAVAGETASPTSRELAAAGLSETNTLQLIRQLQRRIDELEQKVKSLEETKPATEPAKESPARQQVEQLDQKLQKLEQERQLQEELAAARAKQAPKITIGEQGLSVSSANGEFAMQIHGLLQVDSRTFLDGPNNQETDGLILRRVRPIFEGTVFRDFNYKFMPDFAPNNGPTIQDAWLNYTYSPALQLKAGKQVVPIGLEMLQPDRDTFFNERALVTDLVPARDVGFQLHGDAWQKQVTYAAGLFNGTQDGNSSGNLDFANAWAYVGRLFFEPLRASSLSLLQGVGLGVAGSYETYSKTNVAGLPSTIGGHLPGYYTAAQQQFFAYNPDDGAVVVADGSHWRLSPQAYYFYGPFGLLGEYGISDQGVSRGGVAPADTRHLKNKAWEVTASWVITGEDVAYAGGVVPRRAFRPTEGRWGALQLVARYNHLTIDQRAFPDFADPATSADSATGWSVGLNWYLNQNIRIDASYSHTHFDGGGGPGTSAPATVTRQDEDLVFTRLQLAF